VGRRPVRLAAGRESAALGEVEAAVVTLGDQPFISAEVIAGVLDTAAATSRSARPTTASPVTRCCSSGVCSTT
jgi:CTP:molybdopterin cytidylyltransferase MocA